ncbi:MAG: response regulator [Pseudanabaenaceae cyanobacterium]
MTRKAFDSITRYKLSRQLLSGFGLSMFIVVVCTLSIVYTYFQASLAKQMEQRARTITQGIEFASEGFIEDGETFIVTRIVQNYATLPSVMEISVVDPEGMVLAHSRQISETDQDTPKLHYSSLHPELVELAKEASKDGREKNIRITMYQKAALVQILPFTSQMFKKLEKGQSIPSQQRGLVIVSLDLGQMEREEWSNVLIAMLVITCSTVVILAFMALLIRRLVLFPLRKIDAAIRANPDQFALPELPKNEIGFLGESFANMVTQLKDYRKMELDIAERKYAEIAKRYKLATQAAKVWVWDWNVMDDIFILECGIQEWLGYHSCITPTDLLLFLDQIYVDDRTEVDNLLKAHLNGETQEFCCEHRLINADGVPHWFLSRGQRIVNHDGNVERIIGTITDIEERKQNENLIQQQAKRESLVREITQRIRESLDLETIFNTAVAEIKSFMKADRVGIFRFYPNTNFDDGEFVAESVSPEFSSTMIIKIYDHCFAHQYTANHQKGEIQVTNDIHNANLDEYYIEVLSQFQIKANLVVPLLKADKLWGLLCIHQCSSPRVWQDLEIDLVQQIAHQLSFGIQQASLFQQVQLELKERLEVENKLTEANHQLALSNQELSRATKLKDEFLASMSHELRTPLNAILGMTEGLQDQIFGTITPQQRKALNTVEDSSTHLLDLINDILDVAKIESGQLTLECNPTSVSYLCNASLAFVKQQAMKKRIQLDLVIPSNLPQINVDQRRILQVLINLLNNAVKFTLEGGRITLEVIAPKTAPRIAPETAPKIAPEINPDQESAYLTINVRDTGIGIAPEHMDRLFKPFMQIDSALNRKYEGTGLGLSLVRGMLELHGGQISVTSTVGVGSCFTIQLPSAPMMEQPHGNSTQTVFSLDLESAAPKKLPLILLVEDNEVNIKTICSYLKAKGYEIIIARNGEEAVSLTQSSQPDLILMDIQMPKMDGLEAIKQIRSNPNSTHTPIIALTALAMVGDREKCLAAGADDYMTKPVKLRELASKANKLWQQKLQLSN